jgi:hypothetical protein
MSQSQSSSTTNPEGPRYFDLHTTGVGYLSRVRDVKVKKGEPFLCVDISALRGTSDAVEYTRFDCRVSGSEATSVIQRLRADIEAKKKVLVGFKIGDLYAETFTFEKGDKAGQTGISLKAHLLRLTFAKVDGVTVYQPPRETAALATAA